MDQLCKGEGQAEGREKKEEDNSRPLLLSLPRGGGGGSVSTRGEVCQEPSDACCRCWC
jgi:hypothetical protein